MTFRRIRTIYGKELADVLRDRRTLIATIVIPVVLYPLLMLVSLQAVSVETTRVAAEHLVVGFKSRSDRGRFARLLKEAGRLKPEQADEHAGAPASGAGGDDAGGAADASTSSGSRGRKGPPNSSASPAAASTPSTSEPSQDKASTPLIDLVRSVMVDDLSAAVRERRIQVGVVLQRTHAASAPGRRGATAQLKVNLLYQPERLRSQSAAGRIEHVLGRLARARVKHRLARLHVNPRAIQPIIVHRTTLSTPGSLLSTALPLVLVLMTITSAIYPAIDLTAGEHERGTLETLMVCPVPTIDLVAGKFLAVTTIAILGAALNLGSVAATVYFGGLGKLLSGAAGAAGAGAAGQAGAAAGGGGFPLIVIPVILASLAPFSVLMSAILIAVCGCARSFKEAQNYVTPVIIAVLLPAVVASIPGARLQGLMLVLPVGNMVLLVRELLSGATVGGLAFVWVILSTCVYAAAAVAVAAQTFGKESVVFADTVSLGSLLSRRSARPAALPSVALASLYVAVLFPLWFYLQNALQTRAGHDFAALLIYTALWMPLFFILLPAGLLWYWRVRIPLTLRLKPPRWRFVVAAVLIGLSMWTIANELFVLQQSVLPTPPALMKAEKPMAAAFTSQPLWLMLLVVAVVPAINEELLFRGFLFSGLRSSLRKWTVIAVTAAVFAAFHFLIFKFATTFVLGGVLAWLCWQSGSIWPGMLAHALHNGLQVLLARYPGWQAFMGIQGGAGTAHLPATVLAPAAVLLIVAWWLARHAAATQHASTLP